QLPGKLELWDVPEGKPRASLGYVRFEAVTADSTLLATVSRKRDVEEVVVKVWDVATGRERATLKPRTKNASPVAFTPAGKTLAAAEEDWAISCWAISLWGTADGKEIATFKRLPGPVLSLAFSPDGKTLASVNAVRDIPERFPVLPPNEF